MLETIGIIFSIFVAILPSIIYLAIVISLIVFAWPVILTLLLITVAIIVITLIAWGISNIIKNREASDAVSKIYASVDKVKRVELVALNEEQEEENLDNQENLKEQMQQMLEEGIDLCGLSTTAQDTSESTITAAVQETATQADVSLSSNIFLILIVIVIATVSLLFSVATGNDFHVQDIVTYVRSLDLFQQFNNFFASVLNLHNQEVII